MVSPKIYYKINFFTSLALLLACAGPCFAQTKISLLDNDPTHEINWMVDVPNQRILDRNEYRNKLLGLRKKLEDEIQLARSTNSGQACYLSQTLLDLYQALGLRKEADALANHLEQNSFDQSNLILKQYYLDCGNVRKLLELEVRLVAIQPKSQGDGGCGALDQIGDLYYRLGDMKAAERSYKKAYDSAICNVQLPGQVKGCPGAVQMGAINSYACFLASSGRISEARIIIGKAMDFASQSNTYSFYVNAARDAQCGTFMAIVKEKAPKVFNELYKRWKLIDKNSIASGLLSKNGHEITEPIFGSISPFTEGCAAAQDRFTLKFGYIDKAGKWLIQPKFLEAAPFVDGQTSVKIADSLFPPNIDEMSTCVSLIDKSGRVIKRLPDERVEPFTGGIAVGSRRLFHHGGFQDIFDKSGEILFSGRFMGPIEMKEDHFSVLITTGETMTGCIVQSTGFNVGLRVSQDPARPGHLKLVQEEFHVFDKNKERLKGVPSAFDFGLNREMAISDKCGVSAAYDGYFLQDRLGKRLSKDYQNVERLSSSCFRVTNKNRLAGLIDTFGKEIIEPKYEQIRVLTDGMAAFQKNSLWGFVDQSGKEVVEAKYVDVGDFVDGVTFYRRKSQS